MAVNSLDGKLVVLKGKPEKLVHNASKIFNDQNLVNTLFTDIIDTSNVTGMGYLFYDCRALTTVPSFNTSNVTDMNHMFEGCTSLTTVRLFDTSKVTNMQGMFRSCSKLTSVPLFDTSKVTNMSYLFYGCSKLTSVPLFDTSKVTSIQYMFYGCTALETIPALDASKATGFTSMFYNCRNLKNIHMHGMRYSFDISPTALEHDALVEVLNNLGTAYNTSQKVTMGAAKLGLLSAEEKAIATNKGWQLA